MRLIEPDRPSAVRNNKPRELSGIHPKIRERMKELCEGKRSWPWYIWGPTGVGKTSIALWLLDRAAWDDAPHRPGGLQAGTRHYAPEIHELMHGMVNLVALAHALRLAEDRRFSNSEGYTIWGSQLWKIILNYPLIVIDDLRAPAREQTRFGDDHLDNLVRILEWRQGKPTIITSNLRPDGENPELLQSFDDRAADRCLEGTVTHLVGKSYRTGGKEDHGQKE